MTTEKLREQLLSKSKIILKNRSWRKWIKDFKKDWTKAGGTDKSLTELIEEFKNR